MKLWKETNDHGVNFLPVVTQRMSRKMYTGKCAKEFCRCRPSVTLVALHPAENELRDC